MTSMAVTPTGPSGSDWTASTIPIGDAIIVLRSNGPPKATVNGVHGATAVVLLATAAPLFT
jgi:hypothetical protein